MGTGKIEESLTTGRKVQYTGRTGRLEFVESQAPIVELADGRKVQQVMPGVCFDFRGMGLTREYDPGVAKDAAFIEAADAFIASGDPRVQKYQIQRANEGELVPPWPTWSQQTVKSIVEMVESLDAPDLEHMIGYELQQESPRRSLIAKLEAIGEREPEPAVEDLAVAPEL